jgi:hypothetical protein
LAGLGLGLGRNLEKGRRLDGLGGIRCRFHPAGRYGLGYWGDPISAPTAPSEPIIIGGGPPLVVNVVAGSGTGDAGGGYTGGRVIHKLIYDRDGKYIGERRTPEC